MTAILLALTGIPSALTKQPRIKSYWWTELDRTKPQTSVSLWNQRKHSGYKLKEEKTKQYNKKKKQLEKAAEYKT